MRAIYTSAFLAALWAAQPGPLLRAAGSQPDAPDWARQAAAAKVPAYPARVSSVVLFQEEAVTVDVDGRRVMRERGAIRILQQGNQHIAAYRTYNTKNGRIRDFQGWLISPSGKAVPYAKNRVIDEALSRDYTFDEARARYWNAASLSPAQCSPGKSPKKKRLSSRNTVTAFRNNRLCSTRDLP